MSEYDDLQRKYDEITEQIDLAERDTQEFTDLHEEADRLQQKMHDIRAACDHFAHYRQSRDYDKGSRPGGWTSTCSECGHVWTTPAPPLEVEVSFKIEASATIDLVAYFNGLSERARKEYVEFEFNDEGYYESSWERPMAWLTQDPDDQAGGINVVPHRVFGERGQPQPVRENVEVDDVEAKVRTRPGVAAYNQDWTKEDMETLRANVQWLDRAHQILDEGDDLGEDEIEDLKRVPGPLDTPLEFDESVSVHDLIDGGRG